MDELEEWLVSVPEQLRAIVAEKIHYEVNIDGFKLYTMYIQTVPSFP